MPEHAYDIDTRAAGFLNATPAEGRQGSLAGNSEDRHVVLMSAGHPGNHVGRPRPGRRNADPQASTLPCIPIRHENGPTLVTGRYMENEDLMAGIYQWKSNCSRF